MIFNSTITKSFIVLVSLGLWLINFYYYEDQIYLFRTAKGFGLNLRVWTMFLYFTMCRSLLRGKMHNHVEIHKFIGYIVFIASIGHTTCHIINTGFLNNLLYNTGYCLTSIILLMILTYLLKDYNFSIFKFTHLLYYPWLILCMMHMFEFLYWFLIPAIIFIIEHLINFSMTQVSTIANAEIFESENTKTIIYLPVPKKIDSVPGAYYYICIPSCGIEFHPYSVASSALLDQLLFLIEVKGDWTKKLLKIIKSGNNNLIIVNGPYLTPSTNVLKNNTKLKVCVCTGLGITPFLSIIDTKIDSFLISREYRCIHEQIFQTNFEQTRVEKLTNFSSLNKKPQRESTRLKIIWVFRDLKTTENFFNYIEEIMKESRNVFLDIYITSKEYTSDAKKEFIDAHQTSTIDIFFCRPTYERITEENIENVYYCGNPQMSRELQKHCNKNNIKFECEIFN
jgi:predicted ferric reductase